MKYIIMCGGKYKSWSSPRPFTQVQGERLVDRTIRLLRENGVTDINISSNDPAFNTCGVPVLHHANNYVATCYDNYTGHWYECFYPTDEPTCYVFGDVVFSPNAIKTIVETETDDIEFFASAPPFAQEYPKTWAEPFAFKVVNTDHLKQALVKVAEYEEQGLFARKPISWEVWQVICNGDLNKIDYNSYTVINDYTCDIEYPEDVLLFEGVF